VQGLEAADLLHHMLRLEQAALRVGEQTLARLGERHAARPPLEQRDAEIAFEPRDLPADRRHGHMQPRRRVANRAGARHFDEIAQCDAV
jgi:hypothetical protein